MVFGSGALSAVEFRVLGSGWLGLRDQRVGFGVEVLRHYFPLVLDLGPGMPGVGFSKTWDFGLIEGWI